MSIVSKISERFHSWANGWFILSIFILFGIITFGVLLYEASNSIHIVTLDTQFFYTPDTTFSTLESYSNDERSYLRILYLTYYIIAPILYTLGFSLLLTWLFQRGFKNESKMKKLNVIPMIMGFFDFVENISIVIMISVYPVQLTPIAWLSTIGTMSKMTTGFMIILLVLIGLIKAIMNRFKIQGIESNRFKNS